MNRSKGEEGNWIKSVRIDRETSSKKTTRSYNRSLNRMFNKEGFKVITTTVTGCL